MDPISRIASAALNAADPRAAVTRALAVDGDWLMVQGQAVDLRRFARIRVVGAGKAVQAMARGLWDALGERIQAGVLIAKHRADEDPLPPQARVLTGGHPVPTQESADSTRALAEFLSGGREDDLVFCLISGGGSALMTLPAAGVTLQDLQALTRQLLSCGASIGEINTLRKHLDQVKGGGLARMAFPARVVTLILSDVVGSPLDVIASGPTVPDPTTYADSLAILDKYGISAQVPGSIRRVLLAGAGGEIPETVKPDDPAAGVINALVASNPQAAEAALAQARAEGFNARLLTTELVGEASQAGEMLSGVLRGVIEARQPVSPPACIIAGGETTVTLRGGGLGGRNQEMALAAAFGLSGLPDAAILTLGTDGEDGPTDAAGAVVTGDTISRAVIAGLDAPGSLAQNDSYHFFQALGDLVKTGPTGTNVNDLAFLFAF